MTDYVVDASVMAEALAGKTQADIDLRARLTAATCHAPHLIDAEVGTVLRREVRLGEIQEATARNALRALGRIVEHRYVHVGQLSYDAWELRHNLTFYDGLYVALAAMLDVPLLTADARLTKAPGLTCRFELVS